MSASTPSLPTVGPRDHGRMQAERDAELQPGDVVQLDPDRAAEWCRGCFLVVTEVRPWGAVGYVAVPRAGAVGDAYYRAETGTFARVGYAEWIRDGE